MTRIKSASDDEIRAILCLAFVSDAALERIQALERFLVDRGEVLHAAEVEGSFDFLLEAAFTGFTHFHQFTEALIGQFGPIIRKKKVSFICRRFLAGSERAVWVHQNGHRVRVDLDRLERVTAEGDYVRLRAGGQDFLHHATMRAMELSLDPRRYIRVHRSAILGLNSIERLRRQGRHWVALCGDGSTHRVAKAYAAALLDKVDAISATGGHHSAKVGTPTESKAVASAE